jgi:outer membrane protein assembly factor BamE (lipoprotein component of BamABCDE complex)
VKLGTKGITDDQLVAKIEKGKSSKSDVEALLGRPFSVDFTDAGFEKWLYSYSEAKGLGAMRSETLLVQFDQAGVVKNLGRGGSSQPPPEEPTEKKKGYVGPTAQ